MHFSIICLIFGKTPSLNLGTVLKKNSWLEIQPLLWSLVHAKIVIFASQQAPTGIRRKCTQDKKYPGEKFPIPRVHFLQERMYPGTFSLGEIVP